MSAHLLSTVASLPLNLGEVLSALNVPVLSQHARLIRLDHTPSPVVVERFTGSEALNTLFQFHVDVLTDQLELAVDDWIEHEVTLSVVDAMGIPQVRHGTVIEVAPAGSDGGVTRIGLTLAPWAIALDERQDFWIFQDKTVLDIAQELFADYPAANWKSSVTQPLRKRSICVQYQESDWSFLCRILAEEGLSIVFEHLTVEAAAESAAVSKCQLVIFDSQSEHPECSASPIRFGRVSSALADDRLTEFGAREHIAPRSVTLSSWDYDQLIAPGGEAESTQAGGQQPPLQDYDGSGAYRFDDADQATQIAVLRQAAYDARAVEMVGMGPARALRVGQQFTLTDHPTCNGKRYVVLALDSAGANNLSTGIKDLLSKHSIERGSYRNRIVCLPVTYPIVPEQRAKPLAIAQTGMVVGVADSVLTTDREHRVKVQFPWQRGSQALNGGQPHNTEACNAPGNDSSGNWIRLAEWLAGPNWGSQFSPRIGDEVTIDFVEGDIDRPLISGSVHNDEDTPPFSAGENSGANHPGTISGIHSQSHDGNDYNRWVHDDTPGQLRSHLQSSLLSSELGLGYLIRQAPHSGQRGQYRGNGLEWRTDGWGTLRASKGVLLSAYTRQNGRSTQLDTHETQRALKSTQALAAQLNQTASSHQAIPLKAYDGIEKLHQHLATEPGPVNGHTAQKPDAAGKLKEPVERFDSPVVALETPNTLLAATSASQLTYAGSDLQLISQQDTHLTGHDTLSLTAGNSASLFTHHGGMSLIAANETVSIAAHGDTLQLTSEQAFTITSTEDRIEILAQDGVTLFGGGAAVELKGANITFKASGTFTVKAASTAFSPGGSNAASIAKLPDTRVKFFDEGFVLKDSTTGDPLVHQAYRIKRADGTFENGITDEHGRTHVVAAPESESLVIQIVEL